MPSNVFRKGEEEEEEEEDGREYSSEAYWQGGA